MSLQPIGDRIVIKPMESEEKSKGGIILPDTAKERPQMGKIIALGTGANDKNGKKIPFEVKVGDNVIFASYAGTEIKHDGEEKLLIMKESDILAIVG